jgi:hypothetical protein
VLESSAVILYLISKASLEQKNNLRCCDNGSDHKNNYQTSFGENWASNYFQISNNQKEYRIAPLRRVIDNY